MRRTLGFVFFLVCVAYGARAADIAPLVAQIKAVGPEGAGSAAASAAWVQLSKLNADAILPIMRALDDATPRAANWLRSALDSIIEREQAAKRPLPLRDLESFLADKRHNGQARRLAYELIAAGDPTAEKRMLPTFLDDPSVELRFEAVAKGFEAAKALPKESDEAKGTLRKLLQASRDVDQVEEISKELEGRGETVDFLKLYGFVTQWTLCAGFDNTDGKGFATPYAPEKKVDLKSVVPGKGGKDVKWFTHVTADKMGAVDLNKAIGKEKNVVAYGYTVIISPEERPVEIRAASATALKIFVNGQETFGRETYHQSFSTDSHIAPARLKKGKNTILIKVCQNDQKEPWAQEWRFQLRITDAIGTPVPLTVEPVEVKKEAAGS
jgi:hypothetical protein